MASRIGERLKTWCVPTTELNDQGQNTGGFLPWSFSTHMPVHGIRLHTSKKKFFSWSGLNQRRFTLVEGFVEKAEELKSQGF